MLHFDLQTLQIKIQLILEQHGFKLARSTYMKIFFNKYTVGLSCSQVVHPWIQPTLDQNSVFYLRLGTLKCGGPTEAVCGFLTAHGVGAPTLCCARVSCTGSSTKPDSLVMCLALSLLTLATLKNYLLKVAWLIKLSNILSLICFLISLKNTEHLQTNFFC